MESSLTPSLSEVRKEADELLSNEDVRVDHDASGNLCLHALVPADMHRDSVKIDLDRDRRMLHVTGTASRTRRMENAAASNPAAMRRELATDGVAVQVERVEKETVEFRRSFKLPDDARMDAIQTNLDDASHELHVTIPTFDK
jgi:HSP20 family molecular chaperone IbpA